MSRVIVKNLPPNADEPAIRQHFSPKGTITDVKLLRKRDGSSRRFAFVGFRTPTEAEAAANFFNMSFMKTSRLEVTLAKSLGDPSLVSSRDKARLKRVREKERQEREEEAKKPRTEDPQLAEYLETRRSKSGPVWQDNAPDSLGPTAVRNESDDEDVNDMTAPDVNDDGKADVSQNLDNNEDVEHANIGEIEQGDDIEQDDDDNDEDDDDDKKGADEKENNEELSDMEWLRRRQTLIKSDGTKAHKPQRKEEPLDVEKNDTKVDVEDFIMKTGRLFLRNLAYTVSEDDLRGLISKYRTVEEIHLPVDTRTDRPKGMAFISFQAPDEAVQAWKELDGQVFQGRILHVIGAEPKRGFALDEFELANMPLKKRELLKKKMAAQKAQFSWNSLYLNKDAVMETVSKRLGVTKSELLDPHSSNMAVKQALAESSVLESVQTYFRSKGVDLAKLNKQDLSDKIILVKNLPAGVSLEEINELFSKHGEVTRVLMPPEGGIAIAQMETSVGGRQAFTKLAFRRLGNSVLYLQKGPKGLLDSVTSDEPQVVKPADRKLDTSELAPPAEGELLPIHASIFVKNLSFGTPLRSLSNLFETLPGFEMAQIKTKANGQSMGYGFVEFRTLTQAQAAISALDGHELDGHALQLKISNRGVSEAPKARGSTKIIIKNIPFETTKKDIRELFGSFGQLRSVRVPKKFNRQLRGFAFADFATPEEAEHAMASLTGAHLLGRRMVMEYAEADAEDPEEEIARQEAKVARQVAAESGVGRHGGVQHKSMEIEE